MSSDLVAEIKRLEKLVYLPGHWQCPKCDFYLVSTNLHAPSGGFSANNSPHQCANSCGPMWRVTHEKSANQMVDRLDSMTDEIEQTKYQITQFCWGALITPLQRKRLLEIIGGEWTETTKNTLPKGLVDPSPNRRYDEVYRAGVAAMSGDSESEQSND